MLRRWIYYCHRQCVEWYASFGDPWADEMGLGLSSLPLTANLLTIENIILSLVHYHSSRVVLICSVIIAILLSRFYIRKVINEKPEDECKDNNKKTKKYLLIIYYIISIIGYIASI